MFLTLTVSANAWGQTWTRVTTMEQLTSGGTFIMGYEATAKSGTIVPLRSADCDAKTTANGYFHTGTTANSSTNSTITMSSVVNTSAYEVYISSPASGKINIQRATSTGNYYGASSGGSSKNTARLYTEGNTTETNLIVEWASETNNQFKLRTGVSGTYKYLKYNTSSPRFAFYSSAGEKIVFYKKSAPSFTITAQSNNTNYGTVSLSGTTITATPKTGYRVSTTTPYTISPSGSATVTQSENKFTVTPTANCTITINFEALPKYIVTLVPGSGSVSSTTLTESSAGAGVTLPTPTLDCGNWDFAGWAEESVNAETTTKPTLIPAGAYNPASNITLYAVYKRIETTEGAGTTEVTKTVSISDYASAKSWINDNRYTTVNIDANITATASSDPATNTGKYYSNDNSWRFYQNEKGKLTITANEGITLKSIKLTFTNKDSGTISYNSNSCTSNTAISVSGQSATFTVGSSSGSKGKILITKISVTYESTSGGASTTYYHSTPECAAPCADPGLAYAIASVTKTVGDAAFTNPLTNNKNVSVTYTSTNTDVATVDNNGQVKIKAVGETTIKATWAGNADYCADEASYTLTVLPKTYTITVANNISNGSVSADKSSAVEGATIKLTATPNTGYKLGTWNIKDASNNPVSVNENGEFTMPASNVTVSATFVSLPKLATPSELSATEINPTSATLNWKWLENTYAAQLDYYYLYIKKEGDPNFTGPITYTNTSCSRTNLEPNTNYIWKVQAISKDKTIVLTSEESAESSFTTAALPTYTVSFSTGTGNPTQEDIKETEGGAGIKLPAGPDPLCPDWTFAGWATSSVAETTSAPTLLKANDKYQPTSDITLYAVYSTTAETTGFTGYEKVTEEPDDWSGKYLLSTGTFTATGAFDATGKRGHLVRETHTPGTDEKTAWEFTLAKVDNTGYFILFPDGTWYLGYDDGTNFARSTYDPSLSVAYLWTPSTEGITNVSETTRKIQDGGSDFRPYAQKETIVYLYKRIEGVLSTSTYNSNPDCTPPSEYTITWWANGEEYHSQTAVEGTAIDVPTNSPNAATYACDDKVFVGWVDAEIIGSTDTKPTLITEFGNITENKDFFAVFATEEGGEETTPKVFETGEIGKNGNSITSGYVLIAQASPEEGYYQDGTSADKLYIQVSKVDKSTPMMLSNPSSVVIKANLGGGSTKKLTNPVYAVWLDVNGNEMGNAVIVTDEITNKTGSDFIVSLPVANATEAYGIRVYHQKESGYNVRYYGISLSYTYNTTTYSGYVTTCEATTEVLSGTFSVGKYEVAQFATGNLQYKPSTDTWRFAKQQYQYVGKDNIYVGKEDYKGWIDLFGWSADDKFGVNPSNDNANYQGEFVDWGKLFPEEGWSTLSKNQWNYLLNQRTNAASLKQIAMVGETLGIMLFPDEWTLPAGCEPTQQTHHDEEDGEDHSCDFVSYNYTLAHWTELEKAGAIFLPAAGRRTGGWGNETISPHMIGKAELDADHHYKHYADYYAYYWTSTKTDGKVNYLINCTLVDKVKDTYTVHAGHVNWAEEARYGQSVRLAKVTSTHIEIGGGDNSTVIAANVGEKVNVKVNRTFKANDGYYTICLPFNIDADEIGKAYQINTITEHVAGEGINVEFNEVNALTAGQPYLLLPSKDLENPIFEGVTIVNTTGETTDPVVGAGIKITFTGIINGVGETTGSTDYYVGDKGYLYNGTTEKLGLRAFFTITDEAGNPTKVRARVVVGENTTTDLDNILNGENTTIKVIKNGQLIIIRNGEKFNAQGQKL